MNPIIQRELITALRTKRSLLMQVVPAIIFALLIVVFNLIADILYGILDPRIRYD